MIRQDLFRPTGPPYQLHRDEAKYLALAFAGALSGAPAAGATVAVTFWRRSGARWAPADAGDFGDPEAVWDEGTATARWWVRAPNGDPAPAGQWGLKVVVFTTDGQRHVADCPLTLMGAMSD
jgi:hypothetical protein